MAPQALNILTLNTALATGTSSLLLMITTGSLQVEIIAVLMLTVKTALVASHSTQAMLTYFKKLAVANLVSGLLIRSVVSFLTMALLSTAKLSSQLLMLVSPPGTSTLASESAVATNQVPLKAAAVAPTGMKRESLCLHSQTLRNARTRTAFGTIE